MYFRFMLLILKQEEKKSVLLKRKKAYLKVVKDIEMTKTLKPLLTSPRSLVFQELNIFYKKTTTKLCKET